MSTKRFIIMVLFFTIVTFILFGVLAVFFGTYFVPPSPYEAFVAHHFGKYGPVALVVLSFALMVWCMLILTRKLFMRDMGTVIE